MAAKFYTLLTKIGEALHANAQITQTTVPWTHMAIGDGGGNPVVPKQEQTGLVREVARVPITAITPDPNNPNWMIVEAVLPNNVGGWTVRETAIMGTPGGAQCIAVGNYPDTYKPVLAEGSVREMVLRMVVAVIGAGTVNLVIDPAVAIASRGWVESLTANTERRGIVELATQEEAEAAADTVRAVTPKGLSRYMRVKNDLAGGVDLNDIKDFGLYAQPLNEQAVSGANYPSGVAGSLLVQEVGRSSVTQIYIAYANGDLWVRSFYDVNGWSPWKHSVAGGRRIAAGLGLSGGGDLEADRSISLAQPGTLNGGTTNASTVGGHTHELSAASQSVAGVVLLADQVIAEAGVDTSRVMTPLRVLQLIRSVAANATESLRGVLRIANQNEVDTGALDTVAVTPKKLRAGFVFSANETGGLFAMPSWLGGFILQWGFVITDSGGVATFTYQTAFPTKILGFVSSYSDVEGAINDRVYAQGVGTTTNAKGYVSTAAGPGIAGAGVRFIVLGC